MRTRRSRKKAAGSFRRGYLIYLAALAVLSVVVTFRVSNAVVEMSENELSNIIASNLAGLTDEQVQELFIPNPDFETLSQAGDNIRAVFENGNFTVKKSENEGFYNIYTEGRRMFSVKLDILRTESKFGLLNYNVYSFAGVSPSAERELFRYELIAPDSYKVSCNGVPCSPDTVTELEGFLDGADHTELPSAYHYSFDHLTAAPDIQLLDTENSLKPVSFDLSEKTDLFGEFPVFESLEAAGCDFDAIAFGEAWSRFLTADLSGGSRGFNTIKPNFIEGSSMYAKARAWATGIDITFVSHHTLDDPPFTGQRVSNVVKYSDEAVSADIYLEKHMTLSTREKRTDVLNSTLYLVKYDGSWRVVNIRGIAE